MEEVTIDKVDKLLEVIRKYRTHYPSKVGKKMHCNFEGLVIWSGHCFHAFFVR